MRMAWSSSTTNTLPSPTLPVPAERAIASSAASNIPSVTAVSIFSLGRKSTTYSAPRYNSVWPFCRPKPFTSVTVRPDTPTSPSASRTSSSLNGRMMAVISFMVRLLRDGGCAPSERRRQRQHEGVVEAVDVGVVPGRGDAEAVLELPGHAELPVRVVRPAGVPDPLPAAAGVERPAGAEFPAGGQVEVAAAAGIGDAEQIAGRVPVAVAEELPADARVQFERVGAVEAGRVVAGIP